MPEGLKGVDRLGRAPEAGLDDLVPFIVLQQMRKMSGVSQRSERRSDLGQGNQRAAGNDVRDPKTRWTSLPRPVLDLAWTLLCDCCPRKRLQKKVLGFDVVRREGELSKRKQLRPAPSTSTSDPGYAPKTLSWSPDTLLVRLLSSGHTCAHDCRRANPPRTMSSDKDLYKLELLSLVSRISQEILNHTSINDKSLAEFVISLHQKSKTKDEFKTKLDEVGAGFEPAFVDTLE